MQGAVVLSYMLVWFYTYCWMGPWPIKSLRTVRVFYLLYGFVCVVWWGLYGTLQAVTATNSGFESCLSMSPSLYIISQYEVTAFWLVFIAAVAFFVNEKTASMRADKLSQWNDKKEAAKRAKEQTEQENRDRVLQDAREKAQELEEEQRQKVVAEQKKLYEEGDGEGDGEEEEDDEQEEEQDAQEYGGGEEQGQEEAGEQDEEEVALAYAQDGD
ncbi:hypothetical protein BBJ28_00020700 [Nothophytophthora sp. Chile5]|nr:hypothetical protein BBJ28_00020700 [Nothophytophthora sp. Chile5]